ncbi:predicted protein [Phaeodactylum tricornutum CCAP 1055/1]|jgi:hypothetical protein|uniref:Uncharacterized protein n=2 Tax=Phaeodactylum tricornutum TaxID=2850 RepID=B5Y3T7_PHATC|nr:predicted protein [Phaeodactylum tricornutum CCAP 1055/1]ACI65184.1 predicted protein [Phaeodactylum tricornutum CCAP 1055/1]|eukprot:XP_002185714.1 predicted protein [Phaeodactylum tricornutum CCAP 1055/1]
MNCLWLSFLFFQMSQAWTMFYPRTSSFLSKTAVKSSSSVEAELFVDENEMVPIAENYVRAKYKSMAQSHGKLACTNEGAGQILRSLLPPVTPAELNTEVSKTLATIMANPKNSDDTIEEDDFVKAIVNNSYWKAAGSLVVKELIYFDALHTYYRAGTPLLNNSDYETLRDNLTGEGSVVVNMKAKETIFVMAVASSRRGDPVMDDLQYTTLKRELKAQGSWVTARSQDTLEKLGLNTFMGYLHRAL